MGYPLKSSLLSLLWDDYLCKMLASTNQQNTAHCDTQLGRGRNPCCGVNYLRWHIAWSLQWVLSWTAGTAEVDFGQFSCETSFTQEWCPQDSTFILLNSLDPKPCQAKVPGNCLHSDKGERCGFGHEETQSVSYALFDAHHRRFR